MRFLSLELRAYGPFTNATFDLSRGDAGLHIIYGPNEAGKSCALRAIRSLLYGVPERTPDSFLHETSRLRIGGTLCRSDGATSFFLRRKGRGKTLMDMDERILDESVLKEFLGDAGEDIFVHLFGLNHEELIRGGRDIVEGRGDVGESLFSAGMGGFGLQAILDGLKAEGDQLYRPRGSSQVIPNLLERYRAALKESKESSLPGNEWSKHRETLQEAEQQKGAISAELAALRTEAIRLKRIGEALPLIRECRDLERRRNEMGDVLLLPPAFPTELRDVRADIQRLEASERKHVSQQQDVLRRMKDIPPPGEILDLGASVADLHKRLGGHAKAMEDLPKLQGKLTQKETAAEDLLKDILPGLILAEVETIRLSAPERARISGLIDRGRLLAERVSGARRKVTSLQTRVQQARDELSKMEEPQNVTELRNAVRRIQKLGDLDGELSKAERDQLQEARQANVELRKLTLWTGTIEALEVLPIPSPETVDRFERELGEGERLIGELRSRLKETQGRHVSLSQEIISLERAGAVPTEADLEAARLRRQTGWALIRAAWLDGNRDQQAEQAFARDIPLEAEYEKSVEWADDVADRLRREADRVQRKAALVTQEDQCREDADRLAAELDAKSQEQLTCEERWRGLWKAAGLADVLTPREMRTWMQRQAELVRRMGTIRKFGDLAQGRKDQIRVCSEELHMCLQQMGVTLPAGATQLRPLLDHCQVLLDEHAEKESNRAMRRKTLQGLEQQLAEADNEARFAAIEHENWGAEWTATSAEVHWEGKTTPDEAGIIVEKNRELFATLKDAKELRDRIEGIQGDARRFEEGFRQLSSRVAPDLAALPADRGVDILYKRHSEALQQRGEREQLEQQAKTEAEELREVDVSIQNAKAKLDGLCRQARVAQTENLDATVQHSADAQALDEQLLQMNKTLLAYAKSGTVEDLSREIDAVDQDGLAGTIQAIEERTVDLERRLADVNETIGKEKKELQLMDGSAKAADAMERAQGLIGIIQEKAERYVLLHMASAILHAEIERYREQNQGPIMKRAGELFRRLTVESFLGLKTDYVEERQILLGQRPSGEMVAVEGMSDGTADQLYLALRLAALEIRSAASESLPLILDDVLINFDDKRATAALEVLAEFSKKTQVVYFTHHAHLLDLARQAVSADQLFVVRMGERSAGA